MQDYAGSATQGVYDVDCTTEDGEDLCEAHDIQGFPTLKWGDPSDLQDYEGGRSYEELKAFAEEYLKPMCSPANIDLCDDEKKAEIQKFQAMSAVDLDAFIQEQETKAAEIEQAFEAFIENLQMQYENAMEQREADMAALKKAGLGLAKAVKTLKAKGRSDEL